MKLPTYSPIKTIIIDVLLFGVLLAFSVGLGYFVKSNSLVASFDSYFYALFHNQQGIAWFDLLIIPFNFNFLKNGGTTPSFFYFYLGIFLLYLVAFKRKYLGWTILAVVLGSFLSSITASVDWHYVFRERPFTVLPNHVDEFGVKAWSSWSSFPSGHVRETALYSTIMAITLPRVRMLFIIFTLFIGLSRIYLGAHYPSDVIAGLIIGTSTGLITMSLVDQFKKITTNWKNSKAVA
jgi:undecaprenyl-diphosphatase